MQAKGGLFLISALLVALPALADELQDELIAREKASWEAWANGNGDAFRDLLAEDVTYAVAGQGVTRGRDAIIDGINSNDCDLEDLDLSDFKMRRLSPDIAVLSYMASSNTTCEGEKLPSNVYSTTIWIREAGGMWRTVSYQETAID